MGLTSAGAEGSNAQLPGLHIDDLKPGQEVQGIVQKIIGDVGIFVDIGAERPGLVPRNKLLEGFCANAEERKLEPGDRVKVWVCLVSPQKFILSMVESKAPKSDGSAREPKDLTPFKDMSSSQWVTGRVTTITTYGAFVAVCPPSGDVESEAVGLVHKREIKDAPVADVKAELSVDQEVQVRVIGVDTKAGTLSLSMKSGNPVDTVFLAFQGLDRKAWLTGLVDSTSSFGAFIMLAPPGGEVKVKGLLHNSEMSEQAKNSLVTGQEVQVRVLNVKPMEKRLELTMNEDSTKGTPQPDLRVFEGASKDEWRPGRVKSLTNFGIFVSLPQPGRAGVEVTGLVPKAESSDMYVADVGDLFEVGQEVQVRLLSVDSKAGRLSLTMKQPGVGNKADVAEFSNITANEWLDGQVASLQPFGAFVQLKPPSGKGVAQGLVHISQIKDGYVESVESVLQAGQDVKVRVLSVDVETAKISLSMKEPAAAGTGEE